MMSTKDYIKPAIKLQVMEQQLMQDVSAHDEVGNGSQLGKGAAFDEASEEKETGVPKEFRSVWEE